MSRSNSAMPPVICTIIQESLGAIIRLWTGGFVGLGKVKLELPERAENVKDQRSARLGVRSPLLGNDSRRFKTYSCLVPSLVK